jgi:hypothetical protein
MRFHTTAGITAGIAIATVVAQAGFAVPARAATAAAVTIERDVVTITGTANRDVISVRMNPTQLLVDFGFDGTVDAQIPRSRYRQVRILAGAGDDGVSVVGTGDVPVTISGEAGNDGIGVVGVAGATGTDDAPTVLSGDDGNDNLIAATPGQINILAGAGNDRVDAAGPGAGAQIISLGEGDDRLRRPFNAPAGTGRDTVDAGTGRDTLELEGTFSTESLALSAVRGHLVIDHDARTRIVADGVEDVTYIGFGGLDEGGSGDAVAVNDLAGTGVTRFTADFSAGRGSTEPNNSADTLTVRGTPGTDHITVTGSKTNVLVSGLTPTVAAIFLQPEDFLLIDTLEGNDTVDSSGLQRGLVQLLVR